MGQLTISMAMFNSYVSHYKRVTSGSKVMLAADGGFVLWTLESNDISAPMKTSQEAPDERVRVQQVMGIQCTRLHGV